MSFIEYSPFVINDLEQGKQKPPSSVNMNFPVAETTCKYGYKAAIFELGSS
jgi:hypothetical protein